MSLYRISVVVTQSALIFWRNSYYDFSSSAHTLRRAGSSFLAGKNTFVAMAVTLLADVGVGQALCADHAGVGHRQG